MPKDAILRRYGRSMEALPDALSVAHRAWVFDNSDSRRRLLLKRDQGAVKKLSADLPAWAEAAIPPRLRRRSTSAAAGNGPCPSLQADVGAGDP